MKSLLVLGLLAAAAHTLQPFMASADDTSIEVNLGTFENIWPVDGTIEYTGDYGQYVSSDLAPGTGSRVLIKIDLAALLADSGYDAVSSAVLIEEDGYYSGPEGADIDYFAMTGLTDGAVSEFWYEGPDGTHSNEDSNELFGRVGEIDFRNGDGSADVPSFVALGRDGRLGIDVNNGYVMGPDAAIYVTEVGSPESFSIAVTMTSVPAPGALALLGLAATGGTRRRRA